MNDTELDEILDTWKAPPAPTTLRPRTLSRFAPKERRRIAPIVRKSLVAIALAAMLLFTIQAIPQTFTPRVPPPYTVDSVFVRYSPSGAHKAQMFTTSYNDTTGREILLSRYSQGGNILGTALLRILDVSRQTAIAYTSRLPPLQARWPDLQLVVDCASESCVTVETAGFRGISASSGCVKERGAVDHETILDYPTTAMRFPLGGPRRRWAVAFLAPDLGCFALRITTEEQQPDGSFQTIMIKQAVKVVVNR
jgi:hypothetical protein